MTILISKVGTLIQILMGVGSATFPIMGPMRGQYVFLMAKIHTFMLFLILISLFWVIEPHFIK